MCVTMGEKVITNKTITRKIEIRISNYRVLFFGGRFGIVLRWNLIEQHSNIVSNWCMFFLPRLADSI